MKRSTPSDSIHFTRPQRGQLLAAVVAGVGQVDHVEGQGALRTDRRRRRLVSVSSRKGTVDRGLDRRRSFRLTSSFEVDDAMNAFLFYAHGVSASRFGAIKRAIGGLVPHRGGRMLNADPDADREIGGLD